MPESFACPNCRMLLQLSPDQLGRQVRCPVCGLISIFGTQPPPSRRTESAASAGSATDDSWESIEPGHHEAAEATEPARSDRRPRFTISDAASQASDSQGRQPPEHLAGGAWQAEWETKARSYVQVEQGPEIHAPDQAWWLGFIFGLLSLMAGNLPCLCCLMGPFGSLLFGLASLSATWFSRRGPKTVNVTLAIIGLAISLFGIFLIALGLLTG